MNQSLDLRVRKTYSCLINALLDLLKEKDFEEITVNELCETALVGRGTFYKHFSDKYDFLSFVLREMLEHYLQEAEEKTAADDPCSYYTAFFDAFMQYIEKNNKEFGPPSSNSLISVLLFSITDIISKRLEEHFKSDMKAGLSLVISPASAARFLTGAMAQSASYCITHPDEVNRKKLIKDMRVLVENFYA